MSRQLFEYHPVIGHRFIPNLKARVPHENGGYLVQTNDSGFRSNRPFAKERTPGYRRVLLFGDSCTAADGVSNAQRFSDLIEAAIPRLEVDNFGLPGTGTDQQYLVWREFAQGIEHDLVVIAPLVENVRRVLARYRPYFDEAGRERIYAKPYYTLEGDALRLHHVPPLRTPIDEQDLPPKERDWVDKGGRFQLLRRVVNALGAKEAVQRVTGYQPVPEYDASDTPGWLLMRAILAQWVRAITTRVVIMPIPLYQHVEETSAASAYQERFRELAMELGCTLHDPLPDLLRYDTAQRRRFRFQTDGHPSPEGHAALARSLAPVIERVLARGAESRNAN
jgi:lysophospholipase L1-like esterase